MLKNILGAAVILTACVAGAESAKLPETIDLTIDGKPWLRTMCAPYDAAKKEDTYKVYTNILDFAGEKPITKGAGGKYPHHRGLFIGWRETVIGDKKIDSWHLPEAYQQLSASETGKDGAQILTVDWNDADGHAFIREKRTIAAHPDGDLRVIDFSTSLTALEQDIQLKGDLQHAGMHVRMAQEVADRDDAEKKAKTTSKDSTTYIFPEGAQVLPDDKVTGAWWVACSCVVDGKRYSIVHMTWPGAPGGVPVYSVRGYARFGSFFEPTLKAKTPLDLHFRVVVSEKELDQKACQALYDAYAKEQP